MKFLAPPLTSHRPSGRRRLSPRAVRPL